MSDLWRARLVSAEDDQVLLTLLAIHPDAGTVPSSKVFAMRLLTEAAPQRLLQPDLAEAYSAEAYWDDVAMLSLAAKVITDVEIDPPGAAPMDEETAKRQVTEQLRASGLTPDDEQVWQAAFAEAWRALWQGSGREPTARMAVGLADRSWAVWLEPGTEWDSAAYG